MLSPTPTSLSLPISESVIVIKSIHHGRGAGCKKTQSNNLSSSSSRIHSFSLSHSPLIGTSTNFPGGKLLRGRTLSFSIFLSISLRAHHLVQANNSSELEHVYAFILSLSLHRHVHNIQEGKLLTSSIYFLHFCLSIRLSFSISLSISLRIHHLVQANKSSEFTFPSSRDILRG